MEDFNKAVGRQCDGATAAPELLAVVCACLYEVCVYWWRFCEGVAVLRHVDQEHEAVFEAVFTRMGVGDGGGGGGALIHRLLLLPDYLTSRWLCFDVPAAGAEKGI